MLYVSLLFVVQTIQTGNTNTFLKRNITDKHFKVVVSGFQLLLSTLPPVRCIFTQVSESGSTRMNILIMIPVCKTLYLDNS